MFMLLNLVALSFFFFLFLSFIPLPSVLVWCCRSEVVEFWYNRSRDRSKPVMCVGHYVRTHNTHHNASHTAKHDLPPSFVQTQLLVAGGQITHCYPVFRHVPPTFQTHVSCLSFVLLV
jgi:hypothetical protein